MSKQPGRAMGGSCLGGILGGVIGIMVGGAIGGAGHGNNPARTPLDLLDSCAGLFGALIGAGIGGLIGAIGGSAIGAGIATRSCDEKNFVPPSEPLPGARQSPQVRPESTEAELARLKERMAELEERTRREDQQ